MKNFFLLLTLISSIVYGQKVDTLRLSAGQSIVIDSILIKGNSITEDFIILRELTFEEGDTVDHKILEYNRERVYSLALFNYVDFFVINESSKNKLLIEVFEKWYLYPIPFLYFNEDNFKNATYGISFLLQNFRGRNESISAYLAFGYDPTYSLRYTNPWLNYKHKIILRTALSYQDFGNKSYNAEDLYGDDFEYKIVSVDLTLGKRLNQFNELYLHLGYNYVEAPASGLPQITASGNAVDRIPYLGFEYLHDTRDLKLFPREGNYSSVQFLHNGFDNQNISYNIFRFDFRQYRELFHNLTVRWRFDYRNAFGPTVPFYDYSYLGYDEYVRGHRDNDEEGKQRLLGSAEFSYTLIKEWKLSLDLPVLPKSLTSTRIGVNINIFVDAGTTFNEFEELFLNRFNSGYGLGLNILFLPHNSIRFEYAVDEYMNGEIIIGTGFSF